MIYDSEYFKKQGSIGGKKHDAKKSAATKIEKYGSDYFSRIGKIKKKERA